MQSVSDICIPDRVHDFLRGRGWGIIRASDYGLDGQPDENVWAFARRENRVLLSIDDDFPSPRQYPLNSHPGCIMIDTNVDIRSGESVIQRITRVLTIALPHLPTKAEMRQSKVYLTANQGIQVIRSGEERELYREP